MANKFAAPHTRTLHSGKPLCRKEKDQHFQIILDKYILKLYIMKTVSLKIDDSIFGETEKILSRIKKPRNRYIN
jgi:hypothetical protein